VTASGIHGKVHEAKGDTLVLEISPNAYLTVDREAVKRKVDPNKPPNGTAPAAAPAKPEGKA
jgi:preprotein translocase subunit YajC